MRGRAYPNPGGVAICTWDISDISLVYQLPNFISYIYDIFFNAEFCRDDIISYVVTCDRTYQGIDDVSFKLRPTEAKTMQ